MSLKESMASRLHPLRNVVEELQARREQGMNHFGKEEMAVTRLLNVLDELLNSDTCESGGLLLFLRQAVRDTLPYATLTHKPLEKVGERALAEPLDGSRYWIVCALCLTGSLKETIQRTFEATDIMHGYFLPHAIVHSEEFKLEFLQLLTWLTMPMNATSVTSFDLDITALQLFYPRSQPVSFARRRNVSMITRGPPAAGGGGSDVSYNGPAGGGSHHRRRHHDPAVGDDETTSKGGDGEDTAHSRHRHRSRRSGNDGSSTSRRAAEGGETCAISTQTVLQGKHIHVQDAATIDEGIDGESGIGGLLSIIADDHTKNDEEIHAEALRQIAISQSPLRGQKRVAESWSQTDKPSPSISFAEFCKMENDQKERELHMKQSLEKAKQLETLWHDKNEEMQERLEAVLKVLNATRSLYNDCVVTQQESEQNMTELTEDHLHPLVPKILAVVFAKAQVVPAGTPLLTRNAGSKSNLASEPPTPTHNGGGGASSAKFSAGSGGPGSTGSPTVTTANTKVSSDRPSTKDDDTESNFSEDGATTGAFDLHSVLVAARHSDAGAGGSLSRANNSDLQIGADTPPAQPVGTLSLIISMPVEKERESQLRVQGNICGNCDARFPAQGGNFLSKVASKAGSALSMQKPRRCHYCCALYCHKCHTNKSISLPFRIFQRWDFAQQHVCNNCFDFLGANFDRPLYSLRSLPRELSQRPTVVQVAKLRPKLLAINRVVAECRDALNTNLASVIHSHYFTREDYYSILDFTRLRGGEGNKLTPQAGLAAVGILGNANDDLFAILTSMYKKMRSHASDCRGCHSRSTARCLICMDVNPVRSYDEDGTTCSTCGTVYHLGCLEAMRCKKCAENEEANI